MCSLRTKQFKKMMKVWWSVFINNLIKVNFSFLLVGVFLAVVSTISGQTVIWNETFPDADGVANDPSNDWTSSCSACVFVNGDDHFEVRSNVFMGRDMKGTGEWNSEWVDISGYTNVSVSVQVGDLNNPDLDDNITVSYSTNGGLSYTNLSNGSYSDDIFGFNVAFAQDINADSISIRVTMATNFGDDIYFFDNVMIVQPEAQPGSGYTLDFDDAPGNTAGDVIELDDNFPNLVGGDFTITAWVNSDNVSETGQRIFCDDATNALDGFALSLGDPGAGSLRFYMRSVTPVVLDVPLISPYLLSNNAWYHVAITHNALSNRREIFINGVLAAASTYVGAPGANPDGRASIGGEVAASPESTNRFNGEIDEVSIWNTVLTATAIRQMMCQKLKGNEAGLLAYYRFDDGAGQTVRDETGTYPGGMVNMDPFTDWGISAASIGDTSVYGYHKGAWLLQELILQSSDGDSLLVGNVLGDPEMVHVYNVQEPPNSTLGADGIGGNGQYFGVYHAFGTLTNYTATYHYRENDTYQSGILDELAMVVYRRDHNADSTWETSVTGVNILGKTLTALAQNTEFILGNSFTPLPISLLSFDVFLLGDEAEVRWETASEINNHFFTVERSTDAEHFTAVFTKAGAGNSTERRHYREYDRNPLGGVSYYRLKQTDFDGNTTVSRPVSLNFSGQRTPLSFYPNPASNVMHIDIRGKEYRSMVIYSSTGIAMPLSIKSTDETTLVLDISNYHNGMYFAHFQEDIGGKKVRGRFVVYR
jgi:hypothetical protein